MAPRVIISLSTDQVEDFNDLPDLIDDNESTDDEDSLPDLIDDNTAQSVKHRMIAAGGHFVDDVAYTVCSEVVSDEDYEDEDSASFDLYVENFRQSITPNVMQYLHIDWVENLYDPQYPDFENYINQSLVCALNRSNNGDMFCTKRRCGLRGHFCEVMMKAGSGIDQLQKLQDRDPDVEPPVTTSNLPLRCMHSVEGEDSQKCSAQMVDVPGYNLVSKKDLPLCSIHLVEGEDSHECIAQMVVVSGYSSPGKQR